MNVKWLVIIACLLFVACESNKTESRISDAPKDSGAVENSGAVEAKSAAKEVKVAETVVESPLEVGNISPDIQGSDMDGVEFKLSDYRGKVVMLDFWGDW